MGRPGSTTPTEELAREVDAARARLASLGVASTLPRESALFVRALDQRMNSNTVLATVPGGPEEGSLLERFARWLDAGAPGLARAAEECDWEGHFARVRPGPAPRARALTAAEFREALDWLLRESLSFYAIDLAEPEALREGLLAAELPEGAEAGEFYEVEVASLERRVDYFDEQGNDRCLLFAAGARARVLFTNGSD